ncbi:MAG: dihydrodipicolinate synthase family protein, partial [Candidatus Eremiobacteraeota bacterium]|nr:dihydrodipicolinate synthase family protein [Candidatus Eremiobacteraeota bacterium]
MATQPRTHAATGIIPAALTPMHDSGDANTALLVDHCRGLLERGCTSVLVLGTTGEANSFTLAERRTILESVLAGGIPPDKLIVGTGCCAVGDTIALTQHALSVGVRRALVLPPFFYKNLSDEGLFRAFATTIERIGDDRLRLFVYLIPQLTGIEIGADLIEKLHSAFPTVITGLKDSSGKWPATEALCKRLGAKIDVLVGTEALLTQAVAAGASGCITATGNVAASLILRLYDERGGVTDGSERTVQNIRAAFEDVPLIPGLKAYL